jgi:hypothetical protein
LWRVGGRPSWRRARVDARKRKLDRVATAPIAAAQTGTILKIAGRVEAVGELMEAPLTGATGVATLTSVDIVEQKYKSVPTLYVRDERVDDFLVRDDSGVALVRGRRACLVAPPRPVFVPDAERQRRWLRRWHAHDRFLGFPRTLSFFEAALAPGAEVVVLGKCVERSGAGEGPYRDGSEVTIILDAPERGYVIVDW